MIVPGLREKCKAILGRIPRDLLVFGVVVCAATLSFGLGYLAGLDAREGREAMVRGDTPPEATTTEVAASRFGSKYYFLSCAGAKNLTLSTRILFPSPEAAEREGYTLAEHCRP